MLNLVPAGLLVNLYVMIVFDFFLELVNLDFVQFNHALPGLQIHLFLQDDVPVNVIMICLS